MSDVLPLRKKRVIIASEKYIPLAIMAPEEKRGRIGKGVEDNDVAENGS